MRRRPKKSSPKSRSANKQRKRARQRTPPMAADRGSEGRAPVRASKSAALSDDMGHRPMYGAITWLHEDMLPDAGQMSRPNKTATKREHIDLSKGMQVSKRDGHIMADATKSTRCHSG